MIPKGILALAVEFLAMMLIIAPLVECYRNKMILEDYKISVANSSIGILYEINGFLSGQVRLRGRNNGSHPYKYLEMH